MRGIIFKKRALFHKYPNKVFINRKIKTFLRSLLFLTRKYKIATFISLVLFLAISGTFINYVFLGDNFDVENLNVFGTENISDILIRKNLESVIGKNILLIRSSKLKSKLIDISPYIKTIKVEKKLPHDINIIIEERKPSFLWVNFSGMYLVDTEGFVIEVIKDFENLEISEDELDLLKGFKNINGKDQNNSDNSKGDNRDEKNEKISQELEKLEVMSVVEQFWLLNLKDIEEKYLQYNKVYSYELHDYKELDKLSGEIPFMTIKLLNFDFLNREVRQYIWEGEYRFVVNFRDGGKIIFSSRRDINDQISDLNILLGEMQLKGEKFSFIDLSSKVIVYEIE